MKKSEHPKVRIVESIDKDGEFVVSKGKLVPFAMGDNMTYTHGFGGPMPTIACRSDSCYPVDSNLAKLALWLDNRFEWQIVCDNLGETCLICIRKDC